MADLVSDFSAIHGIHDLSSLTGPAFFSLCYRLAAYEGVIRARWREAREQQEGTGGQQGPLYAPQKPREVVPASRAALQAHPEFSKLISFSTMSRQ